MEGTPSPTSDDVAGAAAAAVAGRSALRSSLHRRDVAAFPTVT
jgi:hypothetical protein